MTAAVFAAACGLAGCETLTNDDQPAPKTVTAPPPPARESAPQPAPPPPKPKRRPKLPAPPADTSAGEPITLVGLSRSALRETLGEPAERTERNPGQTWVWRGEGCSVEVLLLFDMTRNDMFAIDRKVLGTDGSARAEQQCLRRIKSAAHAS